MDGERKQKFLQFLLQKKESKKRMIIIVSHRLSNIKIADHIDELVDRELRSSRDHMTLMENSLEYRTLFKLLENN